MSANFVRVCAAAVCGAGAVMLHGQTKPEPYTKSAIYGQKHYHYSPSNFGDGEIIQVKKSLFVGSLDVVKAFAETPFSGLDPNRKLDQKAGNIYRFVPVNEQTAQVAKGWLGLHPYFVDGTPLRVVEKTPFERSPEAADAFNSAQEERRVDYP